jgi:hypothetical protein
MFDLSRPFKTRNGGRVEIYRIAPRFGSRQPRMIGASFMGDEINVVADWDAETGAYQHDGSESCLDLVYADEPATEAMEAA